MSDDVYSERQSGVSGVSRSASPELLDMLGAIGSTKFLKKGQDLFHQGDAADALYVLQEGILAISTLADDGRRLTHMMLKPGTIFGEMALLDGGTRSATATARANASLRRIGGDELVLAIRGNPDLAVAFLQLTIGRMNWMSGQLENHVFQSVGVRLSRKLVLLLETSGEGRLVRISQSELADHIGATREAVSKALAEMKTGGVVGLGRGKIEVLNLQALHRMALLSAR